MIGSKRTSNSPAARQLRLMALRAGVDIGAGLAALPWLGLAPRGDGHAVLVLPGLTASDASTRVLRDFLTGRGYRAEGWGLGRNFGPRPGVERAMLDALDRLARRERRQREPRRLEPGRRLRARARDAPARRGAQRHHPGQPAHATRACARPTPPVPTTSIYSRSDEHRPLAVQRRTGRTASREHRGRGQPPRPRLQPGRPLRHQRSPRPAGRAMAALRALRVAARLVPGPASR